MAGDAEISIRCRPLHAQIGLSLIGGLTALVTVFSVCCLTLTAVVFPISSVLSPIIPCLVLVLGLLVLAGLGGVALCLDDRILLSRKSISFPSTLVGIAGRRDRAWQDLYQISVPENSENQQTKLLLFFKHDKPIGLDLDRLQAKDLEQLLLAIEVWGGNSECAPSLSAVKQQLLQKEGDIAATSFTQLWQDELNRRFQATNFVPLEPGARVRSGELEVVRQIAFGGFSAVYLVRNKSEELSVLKELNLPSAAHGTAGSEPLDMFNREACILSELDHPNIVSVYDSFQENNRSYMVLEYVPGKDIYQLVAHGGPLPEHKVLEWALVLADVLIYLHEHNPPIVHRDITPENIVLDDNGKLMLIDFGAANEFLGTVTGTVIGKQAYLPPEQLRGKAVPASDIYSLGGTLYFMLTAEPPEPLSELHPRAKQPAVSQALDELISVCTAMEVERRPQSARVLKEFLERISSSYAQLENAGSGR